MICRVTRWIAGLLWVLADALRAGARGVDGAADVLNAAGHDVLETGIELELGVARARIIAGAELERRRVRLTRDRARA